VYNSVHFSLASCARLFIKTGTLNSINLFQIIIQLWDANQQWNANQHWDANQQWNANQQWDANQNLYISDYQISTDLFQIINQH